MVARERVEVRKEWQSLQEVACAERAASSRARPKSCTIRSVTKCKMQEVGVEKEVGHEKYTGDNTK